MGNVVKITSLTFALLTVCFALPVRAQSPPIKATVVDERNQGVPFASVRLVASHSGVITNADGSFQIPNQDLFLRDTLVISCIGYKTRRVAMNSLKLTGPNIIKLQSSAVQLAAVEVSAGRTKRLNGLRLVQRALQRISYNYPQDSFAYIAYYRDYQVKENQYTNLNEALVQIRDNGFTTDDQLQTKIQVIEYKQNPAFPVDINARMPYDNRELKFIPNAQLKNFAGNELATLMVHDPIRNHKVFSFSFINKMDKDFLNNHRFSIEGRIVEDDKELYIVSCLTHDYVTGMGHQGVGKLYIEKGNYRIHKLQYSTNEWKDHTPVPIYNINVEYAYRENLMYLSYISFNNEFKMRDPDDFKVTEMRQSRDSMGFVVRFSHQPEPKSALDPANYDIRINGKHIEIGEVKFIQDISYWDQFHMEVLVPVKNTTLFNEILHDADGKAVQVDIKGVKDLRGREVNVATYLNATQYREIFVQQLVTDLKNAKPYTEIDKYTPLYNLPTLIPAADANTSFWMNTPLKKEMNLTEQ